MYDSIVEKINKQNWTEAMRELTGTLSENIFDEQLAILAATVFFATNNMVQAREIITRGLQLNYKNYELWLILGHTYEITNIDQAYLCYENALFYCNDETDAEVIRHFMDNLAENDSLCVNKCAIIILSYNSLHFTKECIESIRNTCPESAYEIIVVDNASEDGSIQWLREQQDIVLQCNGKNAGFPAGCNQGIRLAQKESDIFLLNNDTILPPNALFWLRMGLYENEKVGATGAVSNYVSNFQKVDWNCQTREDFLNAAVYNNLPMGRPYEARTYLVGFAMLLRRNVLEEVGYLDELFSPGTYEDDDLGLRLCEKGYNVVLCRNSFIFHYGSGGGSNRQKWNDQYSRNKAKLADKWGFDPDKYLVIRYDITGRIQANEELPLKILEVGCGLGLTLMALKGRFPNAELYGIENNKNLWSLIPAWLNICHCGLETGTLPYQKGYFDAVIIGEAFDRSFDQAAMVEKYAEYLNENGAILTRDHVLKRNDILSVKSSTEKTPSIAMCVFTHDHPETVQYVLSKICLNYYFHGIDIYYYDSSEEDTTRKIVEAWIHKGYTNLYYVDTRGLKNVSEKMIAVSKGEGLSRQYDYIWPSKDRTIWLQDTLDAIREHIVEYPDIMYLEVRGNDKDPEKNIYGDGIKLYRDHSLGLTSMDTTLYKYAATWADAERVKEICDRAVGFQHFCLALTKLAEINDPKLCILQGKRITLYNVTAKSTWEKHAFRTWKDAWINVNEMLPECYMPYREWVIKYVASQPWLLGGVARLRELKEAGALTVEKLDEIEVNWEKVSDIPFEEVKKIAES